MTAQHTATTQVRERKNASTFTIEVDGKTFVDRICCRCHRRKLIHMFPRHGDGRGRWCLQCHSEYMRQQRSRSNSSPFVFG